MLTERAVHRLERRYYAAMLSAALVAVALGAASAYLAGSAVLLPHMLASIAVLLAGVNLVGAVLIYRPIRRYLMSQDANGEAFERRARGLPALSGLWIFGLTAAAMIGDATAVQGSWLVSANGAAGALPATLVHCFVFAAYLGLYSYLLALDHLISLRKFLWKRGRSLVLPRRRFALRLVGVLLAVAVGPVLVALSDQWGHSIQHGGGEELATEADNLRQYLHQTLQMDVLGALLLAVAVAFLVTRGLSRPVDILLDAMQRVDGGDLSTKAPVVTDDEFGMLTERFNRMLGGLTERERLRRTFAYFVPESVAAALLADEGAIAPQEREATVLFADIERFTEIASRLAPREVMAMLNDYFGEIARIIHARGGVITQFQGDAVLACFNLPAADPEHARHAVEAALEIQRRIEETSFHGGIRLRTRVGISTGLVVGGTVGGGERLGYTVHGDTVNLAARLEALNKDLGTRILLSARTAELLGGSVRLRDLGPMVVRGFDTPPRLFEPIAGVGAKGVG